MARNTALTAMAVVGGCLLAVALLPLPGQLTGLLICLACAITGGMALLLLPLGNGPCTVYRVRYHAPTESPDAQRIGEGFRLLARHVGWVDLVWQRRAGMLSLLIEVRENSGGLLPALVGQLLPDVLLEPIAATSAMASDMCGHWPLPSGTKTAIPLFDAPNRLIDETLFTGNLEVRLHVAVEGGTVLIQGIPTPAAYGAGFRRWRGPRRLLIWLRRHYRLWEPWPRAGPLCLHFPPTGGLATATLDSRRSWIIPLPTDYHAPPPDAPRLYLGRALADGQPVEIRAEPRAGAAWCGHFGLLSKPADTATTLAAVIAGARARQVSVVHLHTADGLNRGTGSPGGDEYLIDLDAPGVSLHWNLLMNTPLPPSAGGSEAAALRLVLTRHIPLLGAMLAESGLIAASSGPGWTMLLDAARLLAVNHYRLHLTSDAHQFQPISIRTVFDLLIDPDGFLTFAVHEAEQWAARDSQYQGIVNERSGDDAIRPLVQELLTAAIIQLQAGNSASRRQVAAGLRERLLPFVYHPRLTAWWDEPLTTPGAVLNTRPGTLLDIRLPSAGEDSARRAAHRYSLYLLACLVALAAERVTLGHTGPPILLVLEDGIPWWRGSLLAEHLSLLAQAGIAVLTTSPRLPADPLGTRLLEATATWWLHTLDPADAARLEPLLRAWGVPAHLALTGFPPGVALLKLGGSDRPLVTTVHLTDPKEVP